MLQSLSVIKIQQLKENQLISVTITSSHEGFSLSIGHGSHIKTINPNGYRLISSMD